LAYLTQNKDNLKKKIDHNIGVWEKTFRQKLSKIAENCDHNIGTTGEMFLAFLL
jgi:hypothetical protein